MTIVFSIETSCDETSVAIVNDLGKILCQITFNQLEHKKFGGVVPEIASRAHLQILQKIIPSCFKKTNLNISDIDLFCATSGPGLIGGLLVWVFNFSIFLIKLGSTKGAFHIDLDIDYFLFFLLEIIYLLVVLFFRVFSPFVDFPQGVTGLLPPDVFPSPPPWG